MSTGPLRRTASDFLPFISTVAYSVDGLRARWARPRVAQQQTLVLAVVSRGESLPADLPAGVGQQPGVHGRVVGLAAAAAVLARDLLLAVRGAALGTAPLDLGRLVDADGRLRLDAAQADGVVAPLRYAVEVEERVAVVAGPRGVRALDGADADEAGHGAAAEGLLQQVLGPVEQLRVAAAAPVAAERALQHAGLARLLVLRRREILHILQMFLNVLLQLRGCVFVATRHDRGLLLIFNRNKAFLHVIHAD